MPEWHQHNRWADRLIYVPIEELAECVAGGTVRNSVTGVTSLYNTDFVLSEWRSSGDRLDAYIIPFGGNSPLKNPSIGVRYGAGESEYLSPPIRNLAKVEELIEKYGAEQHPGPKF